MNHCETGGTLLNQKFTPAAIAGEKGIDNLAALIRSYFAMNGHHMQFNVIDRQTLIEAQKNPEEYKELIVRVAGYSDYFRNLDKPLQNEIIERTEQSFGGCGLLLIARNSLTTLKVLSSTYNAFYENDIAPKGRKAPAAKLPGLSYFFILISISDIPLYSVIIFDLLIQITARATANPPDSTLLII